MLKKQTQELVSVIIPVYNVDEVLADCIDSVLNQSYSSIEVILIDDGSTDSSGKICNYYAKQDGRISVIHKENGGQATARNLGLKRSKGKYIAFVDSDDIVDFKYIEILYRTLIDTKADIACCDMVKFRNRLPKVDSGHALISEYSNIEAIESLCYQGKMSNSPWMKLIKREIVLNNPFPINKGYEDFAVVYKWLAEAKRIAHISCRLYYYRQLSSSTMHLTYSFRKLDRIKIAEEMRQYILLYYPELKTAVEARVFLANIQTLMWLPVKKKYEPHYQQINKNIRQVRTSVIKNPKVKKQYRAMALISYGGIGVLRVLGEIYRIFLG